MASRFTEHLRSGPPHGELRSAACNTVTVRHLAPRFVRNLMALVALLMLALLLAGCASRPLVLNEAVGPLSFKADQSRGALIVYSDNELPPHEASFGPRSNYKLYTAAGEFLRTVRNGTGSSSRDPVMLDLPVGRYAVTARAPKFGLVTVPIVIQGGRTTVVDLTQDALAHATAANGDWVRLPNGEVIGSRSE